MLCWACKRTRPDNYPWAEIMLPATPTRIAGVYSLCIFCRDEVFDLLEIISHRRLDATVQT